MSTTTYVDRVTPSAKPETRNPGLKFSNGQHKRLNAYPQAGGTRHLSNEQKARLCILAKQAFAHISHRPGDADEVEAWRRAEQEKAVGKSSLTTCTQGDYLPLKAHFAHLAGEDGQAYDAHVKDSTADRRIALFKLNEECQSRGLTLAWPAAICRNKFKTQIEQATAKQLWQLVFHVRKSKHQVKAKATTADCPF